MQEFILKRLSKKKRNNKSGYDNVLQPSNPINIVEKNFKNTELDHFNDALSLFEEKLNNLNEKKLTKALHDLIDKNILNKKDNYEENEGVNFDHSFEKSINSMYTDNLKHNPIGNSLKYDKRKKLVEFKEGDMNNMKLGKLQSAAITTNNNNTDNLNKQHSVTNITKINPSNRFSYLLNKRSSSPEYGLNVINAFKSPNLRSKGDPIVSADKNERSSMFNSNIHSQGSSKSVIPEERKEEVINKADQIKDKYKNNETIIEESTILDKNESRKFNFELALS